MIVWRWFLRLVGWLCDVKPAERNVVWPIRCVPGLHVHDDGEDKPCQCGKWPTFSSFTEPGWQEIDAAWQQGRRA